MNKLRLTALMTALTCAPATWAGIIYNESVDGDFPVVVNTPMTTLNLTQGINTISGNAGQVDFDGFGFNVPVGQLLTSLSWNYTKNGVISTYEWTVYSGSNIPLGGTSLGNVTLSGTNFTGTPLSSGLYSVLTTFGIGLNQFDIDYTFTIQLDAAGPAPTGVPEPGTIALFAGGLAVAAAIQRVRG